MSKKVLLKSALASALVVGAALAASPTLAQSVMDFYKGKTVTFLVPYPPGGSYDAYARLVAGHMGKHIPGNPNIIIQNMPGGGGSKGTNYTFRSGAKDGTFLLWPPDAYATAQLLRPKRSKYDASKFTSLGSIVGVNPVILVRAGAAAKTIDGVRKAEINVACSGRGSQSFIMPAMMKHFLGFKFKLICGYKGSAPMTLALERGEVDAQSSAWASWRIRFKDRITKGEFTPLIQVGLDRDPELPSLPLMQDATDNAQHKKVLEFVSGGSAIGRSLVAPPGTPADRVAALRTAFDAVVKDAGLLADAKKRNALVQPKTGVAVQKIVMNILASDKDIIKLAQEAVSQKTDKCTVNCTKKKKK
ncbi:MAG: tripartite tricarboxylate transporter substrate-binding protein [Rhodospirillaceae bacterium]